MSETVIKSSRPNGRVITIAKLQDGVAIASGPEAFPLKSIVAIPAEDFPAVFKALREIQNEIREVNSI